MNINKTISDIAEVGYGSLPGLISSEVCDTYLNKLRALDTAQKNAALKAKIPFLNQGHDMVYNVQNKDFDLLTVFLRTEPLVQILKHFLNDDWYRGIPKDQPNYILRSLLGRSGGATQMPLHIDSFIPSSGQFCWSLQAAVVLEDQSLENGCTVFIPGSHKFDQYASQDARASAIPALSKKGDVVVWDSRIWHGAEGNKTNKSRWSLIATFGRWWLKQNYDIPRAFPNNFFQQLTDSERAVLGYCSIPPLDETQGIDIKGGYESIRPFKQ